MSNNYPHLLSPLTIKKTTYKNRLVCAPMGGIMFDIGKMKQGINLPKVAVDFLEVLLSLIDVKVSGGAAGFIVGECPVSPETSRSSPFYDYSDPDNMAKLKKYLETIKASDNDIVAQVEIMHGGNSIADPDEEHPAVGPTRGIRKDGAVIHELSVEDIEKIHKDYATVAAYYKEAGFDGVLPHFAHGWLFSQFLSPDVNKRTDEYGGSLENRARISVMTLKAIREACGDDFLIECRISGDEHIKGSYTIDDVCEYARLLSQYADIIHISAGHYRDPMHTLMVSNMYDKHGCNVEVAARIKQAVSIPVAVVGGINTPELAEEIIASGKADLIVLGRQTLSDPHFVKKTESGRTREIRSCLRCMRCFAGPMEEVLAEGGKDLVIGCSVNPLLEHTEYIENLENLALKKADKPKRVLVVGGGVAGMQAAVTANDRGHKVILVEKTGELGGILNYARDDKDKSDLKRFADTLAAQVRVRNIDVRMNAALTEDLMREFNPDVVVAAVGSSPMMPPIPGIGNPAIVRGIDAYAPGVEIGDSVIVLGGGQVGCEAAVHLGRMGKKVTLVEMRDNLAPDAYRLHRHKLRDLIKGDTNIECLLGTTCKSISDGSVTVELPDGVSRTLTGDTIISALGMMANPYDDIESMAGSRDFYAIGDCKKARKIYDAVQEGFLTAISI